MRAALDYTNRFERKQTDKYATHMRVMFTADGVQLSTIFGKLERLRRLNHSPIICLLVHYEQTKEKYFFSNVPLKEYTEEQQNSN